MIVVGIGSNAPPGCADPRDDESIDVRRSLISFTFVTSFILDVAPPYASFLTAATSSTISCASIDTAMA